MYTAEPATRRWTDPQGKVHEYPLQGLGVAEGADPGPDARVWAGLGVFAAVAVGLWWLGT